MYYDDCFYDEPTEFELLMDKFKESISKSVKEEFINEMEEIKKENEELQNIKKNFETIKEEYKQKMQELDIKIANAKSEVRRERLSELMQDFEVVMYKVAYDFKQIPKCNKCNEKRKIHYKSPLGKDMYEDCDCNVSFKVYSPKQYYCYEFRIKSDKKNMLMWYRMNREDDHDWGEYQSSTFAEIIYTKDMKYEDLKYYNVFFKSEEDCKKYCDWLNSKTKISG